MDNGPTPTDPSPATSEHEENELLDLTLAEDPDELFREELEDGTLDIDTVRRDDELAAPEGASATQTVARATDDSSQTASTLDTPLPPLPIVDIHCHIHGVSLSRSKSALKDFEKHGIFNGNDLSSEKKRKAYKKAITEYYQKSEETYSKPIKALNLGHWNFRDDPWVAKKILRSTQRFQDELDQYDVGHPIAITPMLLDFGYTPLGTSPVSKVSKLKGSGDSMTESEARKEEAADTGIFYFSKDKGSEKAHRFFSRDTDVFKHQIEVLYLMTKLWPGQVFPFCPYDPRRPDCLDHVKRAMDTQAYVGVKLYSRCGWMPTNNGAIHGKDVGAALDGRLEELYAYVTQNDIPLLNHTSPTGHPPDGALVYPWRMTAQAKASDRAEAEAFSPIPYPPSNWTKPDLYDRQRSNKEKSRQKMAYELTGFGYYCLYDQLTTSPYAWEPVLKKHPKLRLCFAHFGSKLGVYAHPRYNVTSREALLDCDQLLEKNPMVAGASGHRKFRDYFKKGAVFNRNNHKLRDSHAQESADALFAPKTPWADWVDAWEAAYPDDWSTKITKLVTQYENAYTDISFITGNGSSIPDIVGPIFEDAILQRGGAGRLFDKCMIGTDWYMTELAALSPCDFWRLIQKSCKMEPGLFKSVPKDEQPKRKKVWDHWASKNAFRYLNLKPRLGGSGMEKLVSAYGCEANKLPAWWKALEKFYENPDAEDPPK